MFGNAIKVVRIFNAAAAGATDKNADVVVDMQGYDGVVAIVGVGALTATQVTSLKAQGGAQSNASDAADLAGTKVGPYGDSDGNKVLHLDVYRPTQRYIRFVVSRATANAVIDFGVALLYKGGKSPLATLDTTVKAAKLVASPALGTP